MSISTLAVSTSEHILVYVGGIDNWSAVAWMRSITTTISVSTDTVSGEKNIHMQSYWYACWRHKTYKHSTTDWKLHLRYMHGKRQTCCTKHALFMQTPNHACTCMYLFRISIKFFIRYEKLSLNFTYIIFPVVMLCIVVVVVWWSVKIFII